MSDMIAVNCRAGKTLSCLLVVAIHAVGFVANAAQTLYWVGASGGNFNNSANWNTASDGSGTAAVPAAGDTLDFSALASARTVNCDLGSITFATAKFNATPGTGVVTLNGSLHLSSLNNAYNLSIGSGATLTVDGNMTTSWTGAGDTNVSFLYKNLGTVLVKGTAYGSGSVKTKLSEFYVSGSTSPIQVKGINYSSKVGSTKGQLYMYLSTKSGNTGSWVIGSGGLSWGTAREGAAYTAYLVEGTTTLHSSADWTFNASKAKSTNRDMAVSKKLTFDTADWNDKTTPRTITLKGRVQSTASDDPAVVVKGCGSLVVDTFDYSSSTYGSITGDNLMTRVATTLAIQDTATLKINKNAQFKGKVSLAAGTTLALPPNKTDGTFETRSNLTSLTLPSTGTAKLKIDGTKLNVGDHVVLNSVPTGYADHLVVEGTALDKGRRIVKLVEVDGKLVLRVTNRGFIVIVQ